MRSKPITCSNSGKKRRISLRYLGCVVGLLCFDRVAQRTAAATAGGGGKGGRGGDVNGLGEDGRISMAKVSSIITSSLHVELAGSEEAYRSLLELEWSRFYALPRSTRSPFFVCSEPGRKNAKRLRELAGGSRYVQTMSHKKGQPLCSVASLNRSSVELVAADGRGGVGGGDRGFFSLEPFAHLAKLAPAVVADPMPSALLQSGYNDTVWEGENDAPAAAGSGGDSRHLRAGNYSFNGEGEIREGTSAAAAAARASRPRTRRLVEHARTGLVDAIEITLAPRPSWQQREAESLARRWMALADDQAALARVLKRDHFWGQELQQHDHGRWAQAAAGGDDADAARMTPVDGAERYATSAEDSREPEGGEIAVPVERQPEAASSAGGEQQHLKLNRDLSHEDRKRMGWANLLEHVHDGRGERQWSLGRNWGRRSPGSCGFAAARYTVGPSGKKILIHRPHEIGGGRAAGSDDEDDGCLTALLAYVSMQPEVHYVTARRRSATMNREAAWVVQSGVSGYWPLWAEKIQGQDEIIGVADTGLDLNHCQFSEDDGDSITPSDWDDPVNDLTKRKVVQYIDFVDDFDEAAGHGTHVAGTLAGAVSGGIAGDDDADGMAFQAKLAVFDFGDSANDNALTTPDEVDTMMLAPAYEAGARVHSNSWDTVSTEYTSLSGEVDEYVYLNPDYVVVFAAGNCGDDSGDLSTQCEGITDGEGSVLSPAQAKNVIAVGSSQSGGYADSDMDTVSYYSSRGPTLDGRIKPDIVAPGEPTWSAAADPDGSSCEYGSQTGTSMSTPVVAGAAALVRQYFREGWYNWPDDDDDDDGDDDDGDDDDGVSDDTTSTNATDLGFDPSAALIKAVLVNSAVGMEFVAVNPFTESIDITLDLPPDNYQGHGRVQLTNGLNINQSVGLFFKDWEKIEEGETLTYNVSLYEDADLKKDLRVTLVWTDPPAETGASDVLLHDLDLTVIAQSTGNVYYPNGLSEADSLNNVEKVTVSDTTELETYTIQVYCGSLSENDVQYFAVVANGEFIATNDPPDEPEPSDWTDLLDSASAIELNWQTGLIALLMVLACCAASCACRRCHREQQKTAKQRREQYAIAGAIAGRHTQYYNGRKVRPPSLSQATTVRPKPYPGPVRQPSTRGGAGRFPHGGSSRNLDRDSLRSVFSDRSSMLSGAGAAVPIMPVADSTAPSTPPQEACPECGLLLPDVVQLVAHVETQHGGRATRKQELAMLAAAKPEKVDMMTEHIRAVASRRGAEDHERSSRHRVQPQTTAALHGRSSTSGGGKAYAVGSSGAVLGGTRGDGRSSRPAITPEVGRAVVPVVATAVRARSPEPGPVVAAAVVSSRARGRYNESAHVSGRSDGSSSSTSRSAPSHVIPSARPTTISGNRSGGGLSPVNEDATSALKADVSGDGITRRSRSPSPSTNRDTHNAEGRRTGAGDGRERRRSPDHRGTDGAGGRREGRILPTVSEMYGSKKRVGDSRSPFATTTTTTAATAAVTAGATAKASNGREGDEKEAAAVMVAAPSSTKKNQNHHPREASSSRDKDGRHGREPQESTAAAAGSATVVPSSLAPESKFPRGTEPKPPVVSGRPTTRLRDLRPGSASASPDNSRHGRSGSSSSSSSSRDRDRSSNVQSSHRTHKQTQRTHGRPEMNEQRSSRTSSPRVSTAVPATDDHIVSSARYRAKRSSGGLGESGSGSGSGASGHQCQQSRGRSSRSERRARSTSLDSELLRVSGDHQNPSLSSRGIGARRSGFGLDQGGFPTKEDFGNEPLARHSGIKRLRSSDDQVPESERLTVEMLRSLGPIALEFSPVSRSFDDPPFDAKPPYSPVDRERAEERDSLEKPPKESVARKLLRQLSR